MSILKATIKWLYSNAGKGPASWSENFYFDGTMPNAQRAVSLYINARRLVSGAAVSLVSSTVVDLALPGIGDAVATNTWPNLSPTILGRASSDVPQMALSFKLSAANGSKRTFLMKGIPDNVVVNGRYSPDGNYFRNCQSFQQRLVNSGFSLRVVDRDQRPVDIVGISSTGLLQTAAAQSWGTGVKIQLYRCTDANKQGVTGVFPLVSSPDTTHFQLGQWASNPAVTRGKARLQIYTYPQIVACGTPVATVGKVGSPSRPYVGRRRGGK